MTSRVARKRNATTYVSRIGWLPGALFLGAVFREERSQLSFVKRHEDNVALAERLQEIRADYEKDGFKKMLWADCLEMGFEPSEIREFETDPAAITSCLYVGMGMTPLWIPQSYMSSCRSVQARGIGSTGPLFNNIKSNAIWRALARKLPSQTKTTPASGGNAEAVIVLECRGGHGTAR
jgi:hypothetical protein